MRKYLIFISLLFFFSCAKGTVSVETPNKEYKVTRSNFSYSISSTGYVVPRSEVLIKSKASGEIVYFPFEEGDYVRKGQIILKLDPINEKRNVAVAQANYDNSLAKQNAAKLTYRMDSADYAPLLVQAAASRDAAKIKLQMAKKDFARKSKLFAKRIISQEDFENSDGAYKLAQVNLTGAQAQYNIAKNRIFDIQKERDNLSMYQSDLIKAQIALDDAKQRLDETVIYSPMSGIVLDKYVEVGQIISSGISAVSGGTKLLNLGNITKYYILAQIDEADISGIKRGQKCILSFDALRNKKYFGRVDRIYPKGAQTYGITVYTVKIDITKGNIRRLKPEMSADVKIIIFEIKNTLSLPLDYVFEKTGRKFVFLKTGQGYMKKTVKAHITDGTTIVIDKGLRQGDIVIIPASSNKDNEKSSFLNLRRRRKPKRK